MCGGNVGLGGLGAVGTGTLAGTGGGIGAGASVAGFEICPPVSGGEPPAPFAGGSTCGEEDGNSSVQKSQPIHYYDFFHQINFIHNCDFSNIVIFIFQHEFKYFLRFSNLNFNARLELHLVTIG